MVPEVFKALNKKTKSGKDALKFWVLTGYQTGRSLRTKDFHFWRVSTVMESMLFIKNSPWTWIDGKFHLSSLGFDASSQIGLSKIELHMDLIGWI